MISSSILSLANGSIEQWIVDTLWATTLLMAAALMLRKPVARYFGPEIAYLLWAAPVIRLFMPALTQTVVVPAGEHTEPLAAMAPALGDLAGTAAPTSPDWMTIAFTLWLGGAALFLVTQIAANLQHRRELLDDARPVGALGNIQLVEISNIHGPFAFGLWQRFIALPIGFNRQFDPVERDLALAHELSHHRAGDLWMNFIGLILLSLHWFNPVAWIAWRSFRFDQEAACDARVIRGRPVLERAAYARAIAKAATGRTLALASPLNPRHKLVLRLKLMSGKEHSASRRDAGLALLGIATITAMAMTATVTYAVQPEPNAMPAPPAAMAAPLAPVPPIAAAESGPGFIPPTPPAPPVHSALPEGANTVGDDPQIGQLPHRMEQAEHDRASALAASARAAASAGSASAHARSGQPGPEMRGAPGDRSAHVRNCAVTSRQAVALTRQRNGRTIQTHNVTCGPIGPDWAEIDARMEAGMERAYKQMAKARTLIERDIRIPAADRAEALADLDQDMADMRRELEEAKREMRSEIKRELEEVRRERSHS